MGVACKNLIVVIFLFGIVLLSGCTKDNFKNECPGLEFESELIDSVSCGKVRLAVDYVSLTNIEAYSTPKCSFDIIATPEKQTDTSKLEQFGSFKSCTIIYNSDIVEELSSITVENLVSYCDDEWNNDLSTNKNIRDLPASCMDDKIGCCDDACVSLDHGIIKRNGYCLVSGSGSRLGSRLDEIKDSQEKKVFNEDQARFACDYTGDRMCYCR
ncbi:MAG: hypothetical protein J7K00_04810 [Candidatus Diapherotrites archaeon]|nr:hypothetical protein [Candidatus Diapherotrites archaeon]